LEIDTYFAEVLPEEKYKKVKELQAAGHKILYFTYLYLHRSEMGGD